MPKVLAPRLKLFRSLADLLAKLDKGISKAVRVEIWQAGCCESLMKYCANGLRTK